jgi:acetate kinase
MSPILAVNCGSASIKVALFEATSSGPARVPEWHAEIQGIDGPIGTYAEGGAAPAAIALGGGEPQHTALAHLRCRVQHHLGGRTPAAVAHRLVHGGMHHRAPVQVNPGILAELRRLVPLAPLHLPKALAAIAAWGDASPDVPQLACFDTAFHQTMPRVEQLLPLPHGAWKRGLRRYGFHGLSYEYMSIVLPERHGELAQGRVIVAHLGSGASLCAMHGLRSVATSMGFSALVMMGTRPGAMDPGALLYLMEEEGMTVAQIRNMLYHESGLLGVSGLSSDPRVLLANEARNDDAGERARDALTLYVRRIVREAGALAAVLGGLDLLVFTAGVGEHCAEIRRRICDGLSCFGVVLDDGANRANAPLVSPPSAPVTVGVEPTNEAWVAARAAWQLLHAAGLRF